MAISLPDARETSDDVLESVRLRAVHGCRLGATETEELGIAAVLWTHRAVGQRIRQEFDIVVAVRTVCL